MEFKDSSPVLTATFPFQFRQTTQSESCRSAFSVAKPIVRQCEERREEWFQFIMIYLTLLLRIEIKITIKTAKPILNTESTKTQIQKISNEFALQNFLFLEMGFLGRRNVLPVLPKRQVIQRFNIFEWNLLFYFYIGLTVTYIVERNVSTLQIPLKLIKPEV